MKTLQILRSPPDAVTENMISDFSREDPNGIIKLYAPDIDWDRVVKAMFFADRVVCWW